jgi:hypothetical protein
MNIHKILKEVLINIFFKAYSFSKNKIGVEKDWHITASFALTILILPYILLLFRIINNLFFHNNFPFQFYYVLIGCTTCFTLIFYSNSPSRRTKIFDVYKNFDNNKLNTLNKYSVFLVFGSIICTIVLIFSTLKILS